MIYMEDDGLEVEFIEAVDKSIRRHCHGLMNYVSAEDVDTVGEENGVLLLSRYVLHDVMALGLEFMCWRKVVDTVEEMIVNVFEVIKERIDQGRDVYN